MQEPSFLRDKLLPVGTVIALLIALWYVAAVFLNAPFERDTAARAGTEISFSEIVRNTMAQERPVLPAPHQVIAEIWDTTFNKAITSKRSLVYHAWITLSATLLGFGIGAALGILLAVGIVHNRAMDRSLMPWVIASQTIPILAVAPMVVVWVNPRLPASLKDWGAVAVIAAYLTFFPVTINTMRGLTSVDPRALELMRSYAATNWKVLWKLRVPTALPFIFAALKIAAPASVVGAIIGELPASIQSGLGGAILNFNQYYITAPQRLWATNLIAALLGITFFLLVLLAERLVVRRAPEHVG